MAPSLAQVLALPSGLRAGDPSPSSIHLVVSLIAIGGVLFGIFHMDTLACYDQRPLPGAKCQGYSQLEYAMTVAKAQLARSQWSTYDLICMAISNGLHFVAALLYGGFFVSGGMAAFRYFDGRQHPVLAGMAKVVITFGRIFTVTYIIGHSLISTILTQGPTASVISASTAFLIISMVLLAISVIFLVFTGAWLIVMGVRARMSVFNTPATACVGDTCMRGNVGQGEGVQQKMVVGEAMA